MKTNHVILAMALALAASGPAEAYVDPGLAGSVFQIGYLLFYALLAGLAFCFRPLKAFYHSLTARFRRGAPQPPASQPEDPQPVEAGQVEGQPDTPDRETPGDSPQA